MGTYDLYGLKLDNIEPAKSLLETILGVHFQLRDSMYLGEYYLCKVNKEEKYLIRNNYFENEGWAEEQYKNFKVLFYVNRPQNPDKLQQKIVNGSDNISMLRRRIITDDRWETELHLVNGQFETIFKRKLPEEGLLATGKK